MNKTSCMYIFKKGKYIGTRCLKQSDKTDCSTLHFKQLYSKWSMHPFDQIEPNTLREFEKIPKTQKKLSRDDFPVNLWKLGERSCIFTFF